jgi:low temperature requirement protein LtrA
MPSDRNSPFRQWLSRPPRPHGAIRFDRRVSFLELFYDLVYVAVIGQASHQLAEHISVRGAVEFAIIFGLIWFAWINGSLYVELHGAEDGRTRNIVFVQMCILALLAVFTADAADRDGTAFGVVYSAFLLFMTWLWYSVRGQDADRPEFLAVTRRYVVAMGVSAAVILGSGFLTPEPRLVLWAAFSAAWFGGLLIVRRADTVLSLGTSATDSLVERFGTFTIIVLGEVVLGVVGGLVSAERDGVTIAVAPGFDFGNGPVGALGVRGAAFPERRRMGRSPRRCRLSAGLPEPGSRRSRCQPRRIAKADHFRATSPAPV